MVQRLTSNVLKHTPMKVKDTLIRLNNTSLRLWDISTKSKDWLSSPRNTWLKSKDLHLGRRTHISDPKTQNLGPRTHIKGPCRHYLGPRGHISLNNKTQAEASIKKQGRQSSKLLSSGATTKLERMEVYPKEITANINFGSNIFQNYFFKIVPQTQPPGPSGEFRTKLSEKGHMPFG